MQIKATGKPIKLQCTEPAFPEFPQLLYGKTTDGVQFFDADDYIQKINTTLTVDDFVQAYRVPINTLAKSYGMKPDDFCRVNELGHRLIDGNFVFLFIFFVDPDFLAYSMERLYQIFSNGFTVSDTYLLREASNRLPEEILKTMMDGNTQL